MQPLNLLKRFNRKPIVPASDLKPIQLLDPLSTDGIKQKYDNYSVPELSYATVRDFCDSVDHLPQICYLNGDLKNVQRPWTVKAIVGQLPLGSRLLEIGAGVPLVAGVLTELGYKVTIVDPYEGAGNGPTEYQAYVKQFPNVKIIKNIFSPRLESLEEASFDCIYSVSVLEHIPQEGILSLFQGMHKFLRIGGISLHCVDHVIDGKGAQFHKEHLTALLDYQKKLADPNASFTAPNYEEMLIQLQQDLETFYLSALGHNLWRGHCSYDEFPFRKVVSVQTCMNKA
ncbi:MAG: class I SAM-dependent methyltransferase [Cyanothece sp. SIO1E1]|nr:class I SAM-dependent methyltransferase [Cyanothece sp. SIO1E1]